ncbi:MAG: tRNA lysidine(34) synthetase TilS [Bacteroidales bacterium]|nr:tRNA lysidine(34) synthetase TilS [Bacteroidales bacterium]
MIDRFKSFIEEHDLFSGSDRILLAVSGGIDSMVMLELFVRTGYNIGIAHCNFALRGEASDADEALVEKIAGKHDLPFYTRRFDTTAYANENKLSVQMAARELRYAFFDELCVQHGYDHVATAHHLDDQIETFFINLARGTGIAGLHGIPLKNEKIVRPLMFACRNDLETYRRENKLEYRDDESNFGTGYLRNQIRHRLIPVFLDLNPSFREEMNENIRRLAGTEKVYRQVVELAAREIITKEKDMVILDLPKLKMFKPVDQILYEIISPYGFSYPDVKNVLVAAEKIPGKTFYSSTHRLVTDRAKLLITTVSEEKEEEFYLHHADEELSVPLKIKVSRPARKNFRIPDEKTAAALDFDKLVFPLRIRRWKHGDSFIPLGMKNHKKISDFFIDEKFSLPGKERTWLLISGEEVAWIIGHRIADPFKVTSSTKQIFLITSH